MIYDQGVEMVFVSPSVITENIGYITSYIIMKKVVVVVSESDVYRQWHP